MIERYADHQPIPELAAHLGLNEEQPPAVAGQDLAWLGRVDAEKAPHLAIRATQILKPATTPVEVVIRRGLQHGA